MGALKFPPKLLLNFPACFLHVANLYFIFFDFYFENKKLENNPELGYANNYLKSFVQKIL
jgi:hypothetical protein